MVGHGLNRIKRIILITYHCNISHVQLGSLNDFTEHNPEIKIPVLYLVKSCPTNSLTIEVTSVHKVLMMDGCTKNDHL